MNYYIADTHFGHKNILELCNRPFDNIEQMNDTLTEKWNSKVKNNDHIYILGDMFFKSKNTEEVLKILNGKKHLLLGDHDGWVGEIETNKYFESVDLMLEISDKNYNLILCHYPIISFKHQSRKNSFMVHGHIHNRKNLDFLPLLKVRDNILNACVEINEFIPVTLEELIYNNKQYKEKIKV